MSAKKKTTKPVKKVTKKVAKKQEPTITIDTNLDSAAEFQLFGGFQIHELMRLTEIGVLTVDETRKLLGFGKYPEPQMTFDVTNLLLDIGELKSKTDKLVEVIDNLTLPKADPSYDAEAKHWDGSQAELLAAFKEEYMAPEGNVPAEYNEEPEVG